MSKNIFKVYLLVVALCFGLLIFIYNNFTTVEFSKHQNITAREVTNLDTYKLDSNTVVLGGIVPSGVNQDYTYGFYTSHKSVKFYLGDELYYSFDKGNNLFGNTAGLAWHFVTISYEDIGKEYHIELNSESEAMADKVPTILFGEKYHIFLEIIKSDIVQAVICFLIGIIGVALISCWFGVRQKVKMDNSLLYLGIFSILISIWSFNELPISALMFDNSLVTSNISYIMLMLMIIPFVLFRKQFFETKKEYFWDIICCLSLVQIIICVYLQVFKNISFKSTLWITHVLLVLFVIFEVYIMIKELSKKVITKKLKINIICSLIILFGVIMDLGFYYSGIAYDANMFGRVCYLIYIMVLGGVLLKESGEFVKKAREVDIYERLAFTDTLTGMKNRTKFMNDINLYTNDKKFEHMKIVMLDLNDLKKYNDTMGHEIGDYYIKTAADIITNTFSSYGDCYRIGGDEFCVIITERIPKDIMDLISSLRDEELKHNSSNNNVKVQIACGFAEYIKDTDSTVEDILRKADFAMYSNKRTLKVQ